MEYKKYKDLLNFLKKIIIIYIIAIIICYIFVAYIEKTNIKNNLNISKIVFLYPAIFCIFIYVIFIIRVFFWRDYANKNAIKNCKVVFIID